MASCLYFQSGSLSSGGLPLYAENPAVSDLSGCDAVLVSQSEYSNSWANLLNMSTDDAATVWAACLGVLIIAWGFRQLIRVFQGSEGVENE